MDANYLKMEAHLLLKKTEIVNAIQKLRSGNFTSENYNAEIERLNRSLFAINAHLEDIENIRS